MRRRDGPVPAQKPQPRHCQNEIVSQLVEATLSAEVRTERERQHDRVRGHVSPRMIPDQQNRPLPGNTLKPTHPRTKVKRREQPQARKVVANVIRIAVIEIRLRHTRPNLAPNRAHKPSQRRTRDTNDCRKPGPATADLTLLRSANLFRGRYSRSTPRPARRLLRARYARSGAHGLSRTTSSARSLPDKAGLRFLPALLED